MKKLMLSIVVAGMLMAACNNASKPASTDGITAAVDTTVMPKMKFQNDTHDFGKISEGDKVNYKFSFTNTGKTPLIISNAVASCGCTTPVWPKGPIAPGAGGLIDVTFNSLGKKGLQDKMITITANTNPRQNVVHMIGEVLEKK
jgi:hypothetical protein